MLQNGAEGHNPLIAAAQKVHAKRVDLLLIYGAIKWAL